MKTLISSTGNSLDAPFDLRFGRAAWFCLLDEESGEISFYENPYKHENQGAGGKVVEHAMELGVSKVISGDFGPKARDLLDRFNVQMVILTDHKQGIKDIVKTLTKKP